MPLSEHSPARVIQELLIDRGQATRPSAGGDWPVFSDSEPDSPDATITVKDDDGNDYYRFQPTGEVGGHIALTLLFRAVSDPLAYQKAAQIAEWMAITVYQFGVTIDGIRYLVHCFSNIGSPVSLGKDKNNTRRSRRQLRVQVSIINLPQE